LASSSFFLRILAKENAEIFGSPVTSGFGATLVCACGAVAVSSFCTVIFSVELSGFSTFETGFSILV